MLVVKSKPFFSVSSMQIGLVHAILIVATSFAYLYCFHQSGYSIVRPKYFTKTYLSLRMSYITPNCKYGAIYAAISV